MERGLGDGWKVGKPWGGVEGREKERERVSEKKKGQGSEKGRWVGGY